MADMNKQYKEDESLQELKDLNANRGEINGEVKVDDKPSLTDGLGNLSDVKDKPRDVIEDWWQASERRAEEERARREARERGERLGNMFGDLGQSIGEMIQAWGGAPVLPRDVRAKYDALDKDRQAAYDAYNARMENLRQQQRAENLALQKHEQERMEKEADKDDERQYQQKLLEDKQKREDKLLADKYKHELELKRIANNNSERYNYNYNYTYTDFDGNKLDLRKSGGQETYNRILAYMLKAGIISNDKLPQDKEGNPDFTKMSDQLVRFYVNSYRDYIVNPQDKSAIHKILYGEDRDFRDPIERNMASQGRKDNTRFSNAWNVQQPQLYDWRKAFDISTNTPKEEKTDWSKQF